MKRAIVAATNLVPRVLVPLYQWLENDLMLWQKLRHLSLHFSRTHYIYPLFHW